MAGTWLEFDQILTLVGPHNIARYPWEVQIDQTSCQKSSQVRHKQEVSIQHPNSHKPQLS